MQGISVTLEELLSLRYAGNKLNLPQPKMTSHHQRGSYRSSFRGRGMDFVENRIYQPGDDIRAINWAVTARTGKAHTKLYQQERERPIYLIIDFNQSMFFGTKVAFKSVIAARAASLISWAALKQGDRIGAVLIKQTTNFISPYNSKGNLLELLKSIAHYSLPEQQSQTNIADALHKLKRTIKSGSLIYILSDFYSLDDTVQREMKHFARKHEITNIFIYDNLEKSPPQNGTFLFHDVVDKKSKRLDTRSATVQAQYQAIFQERLLRIKKLSFAYDIQLIELATDGDLVKTIGKMLQRKSE